MSDIQKYTFSLLFTIILFYLIWSIKFILIYIFISSILALFGKPIVEKLNQIKISRFYFPPAISAILTMLALLVIILSLFSTLIPILAAEIHAISEIDIHAVVKKLREPLAKLYNWLSNYGLSESLSSIEEKIISLLSIGNISTVVNNLVSLFGNISIARDRLASLEVLIKLKYFFHLVGLTKCIGNCIAEQIPLITPND